MSQIRELLEILYSELLCKTHIFNFKIVVSQPIRGFQNYGNLQKNQKNTKFQENFKNLKNDPTIFPRLLVVVRAIKGRQTIFKK